MVEPFGRVASTDYLYLYCGTVLGQKANTAEGERTTRWVGGACAAREMGSPGGHVARAGLPCPCRTPPYLHTPVPGGDRAPSIKGRAATHDTAQSLRVLVWGRAARGLAIHLFLIWAPAQRCLAWLGETP
eukprot:CAMPEP_0115856160 /NCGR_PEP_ID=MMETSP0287-20121206/14908_1 /TAXON_ID=412157 /ORGANISM="Chrysochromulina rotalis, Strain UIO044" /LENGTH=129 /DNA_ID=CAMNT_0003310323 /DNA_START=191 /DNA_END=581 /DNA_ORIENTATION=+